MVRIALALFAVGALGLASRLYPIGWSLYDKTLGDVLYAVLAYLGLALVLPRKRRWFVAILALGWCLAAEFFQATGIPARYERFVLVRWVIGTTFSWHDVGCYFIGVGAALALDAGLLRPGRLPSKT
jgi:hypothetical protein